MTPLNLKQCNDATCVRIHFINTKDSKNKTISSNVKLDRALLL